MSKHGVLMVMIYQKVAAFLRAPVWMKYIKLETLWSKLVTEVYYRKIFKRLGAGSLIRSPLLITNPKYISIGDHVQVREGLRMEAQTGWLGQAFTPDLIIGDNVSIEQHGTISCANKVVIGRNTVISYDVTITDNDHTYEKIGVSVMLQPLIVKKVIIGENCFIGTGAKILAGTVLGKQCIVGSNSVVRGEFPDYSVIVGSPARVIKRYNTQSECWERV